MRPLNINKVLAQLNINPTDNEWGNNIFGRPGELIKKKMKLTDRQVKKIVNLGNELMARAITALKRGNSFSPEILEQLGILNRKHDEKFKKNITRQINRIFIHGIYPKLFYVDMYTFALAFFPPSACISKANSVVNFFIKKNLLGVLMATENREESLHKILAELPLATRFVFERIFKIITQLSLLI